MDREDLWLFKPEITVLQTSELVDKYASCLVEAQIRSNPNSILTLPTGSSPIGMYRLLVIAHKNGLDMSGLTTTNLDEYWPLPKNHPQSYAAFMSENLFNHVNIPDSHRNIPDSSAENPGVEADRYQNILKKIGPADLAVLGIGPGLTCHIGFNERGSDIGSRTRLVNIDPETVAANARFFGNINDVPSQAITQGIADILEAKKIILIAKGKGKAQGIQRALEEPVNKNAPASFLRLHPKVTFILDKDAASLLDTF